MVDAYLYKNGKKTLVEESDISGLNRIIPHEKFRNTFEIYAHQGLGSVAKGIPWNTIPALLEALKAGFDGMECDTRRTSDGAWVMSHDATISGTVDGVATTMEIETHTLSELKTVLLNTSAEYGDIYIPTLNELLQVASYTGMKLLVEFKGGTNPQEIAEIVMQTGMQGKMTYMLHHRYWSDILAVDRNASFAEVIFGLATITDFTPYTPFLTGSNTVSIDYQANAVLDADNPDLTNVILAQKAGLSVDYWNIASTAHIACFNTNPKHITVNGADVFDYLSTYLENRETELLGN